MKISKKTKKAGALAVIISFVLIGTIGVLTSGILKTQVVHSKSNEPYFPKDHLFVDATYLVKTGETNSSVNVTCDLYLTNIWEKESGKIKAIAYVIETKNNFAVNKSRDEIGLIKANSTAEIAIPVTLLNSSYKIEVLLFENDKLSLKGELTISARPKYTWEEIQHRSDLDGQEWVVYNSVTPKFYNVR